MTILSNIERKRQSLLAEKDRIRKRQKRRKAEADKDDRRFWKIDDELHRLKIIELVGVENGVVPRYRSRSGKVAKLNDTLGTVKEVRRTRCSVQFGEESWTFPVDAVLPASEKEKQGFKIVWG